LVFRCRGIPMNTRAPAVTLPLCLLTLAVSAAEPQAPPSANPATATASAAPTAAVPAASAAPKADDPAALAKAAATQGYKPRQRDGKTVYCRKESKVGTRFESTTCITQEQVAAVVKRGEGNRDSVEELQHRFMNQPGGDQLPPVSLLSAKTSH